jgi:hypothetical protein
MSKQRYKEVVREKQQIHKGKDRPKKEELGERELDCLPKEQL